MSKKVMSDSKRESIIKQYKIYSRIDWVIFIVIIALFALPSLVPGSRGFMELLYSIPLPILVPLFIVFSAYNIWSFWLYVKVWNIDEIPKGGTYWVDWVMSIALTGYELFLLYSLVFR